MESKINPNTAYQKQQVNILFFSSCLKAGSLTLYNQQCSKIVIFFTSIWNYILCSCAKNRRSSLHHFCALHDHVLFLCTFDEVTQRNCTLFCSRNCFGRESKHRWENHKVAEILRGYSIWKLVSSGFFLVYISDAITLNVFLFKEKLEGFKAIYMLTFVIYLKGGYGLLLLQSILCP